MATGKILDYKLGKYASNVGSSLAFTGVMSMFFSVTSAFTGPYELLFVYTVLLTDWYRATADAREAWMEKHHLSKINKARMEWVVLAGVVTALVGGTILGVVSLAAASPFIFISIMSYRVAQSLNAARKESKKASQGALLKERVEALSKSETKDLGEKLKKEIENYSNLGLKFVLLKAKPTNFYNLEKNHVYIYLDELQKLKYCMHESAEFTLNAGESADRIKRKINLLNKTTLLEYFSSFFSPPAGGILLSKNNSKDLIMINNVLKNGVLELLNNTHRDNLLTSCENVGEKLLQPQIDIHHANKRAHLFNAFVFAVVAAAIVPLFKIVVATSSVVSMVAGCAVGVLGLNTIRTVYNGPEKVAKTAILKVEEPKIEEITSSHTSMLGYFNSLKSTFVSTSKPRQTFIDDESAKLFDNTDDSLNDSRIWGNDPRFPAKSSSLASKFCAILSRNSGKSDEDQSFGGPSKRPGQSNRGEFG